MKCPHCKNIITSVQIQGVKGIVNYQKHLACIAHICPLCSSVISVQVDPIALQADTLDGVAKLLMPHLQQQQTEIKKVRDELRQVAQMIQQLQFR